MTRTLLTLAALAVAVATALPASAYTPNPEDLYPTKPFPCIKCGVLVKPGDRVINPILKRSLLGKINRVAFNPQPEPPGLRNVAR